MAERADELERHTEEQILVRTGLELVIDGGCIIK
jgi:hypothetical protein